jgi:phenylacetate-CoA ligase
MSTLPTFPIVNSLEEIRTRIAQGFERDLPGHVRRLSWDAPYLAAHQRDRLRALLAHAVARSDFHARRLRGIDPSRFELADLAGLPVMTKAQMMDEFDAVVTDRRLRRALVADHLAASVREPRLLCGRYVCLASGGSSGQRGMFVQCVDEYTSFAASIMRPGVARILAAGGSPPGGLRLGMVAAASPVHSTGFAAATALDGPVQMISAAATLPLDEIVARLNAAQPALLMGYPSKLAELAAERHADRLKISPIAISSTSENLTAGLRTAIEDGFGVAVVDQFASTEGLVGHSEPGATVLRFASDMCITELVDEHNRPVPDGVASAKVLVTNLHNLTQPLIRYELNDRFVRMPDPVGCGHLHAAVDGRSERAFRYGTVEVHPLVIGSVLLGAPAVRAYQVRQTVRGVDVSVVAPDGVDADAVAARIAAALRRAGLGGAQAAVRVVDDVARDPQTGKPRRFVALS